MKNHLSATPEDHRKKILLMLSPMSRQK